MKKILKKMKSSGLQHILLAVIVLVVGVAFSKITLEAANKNESISQEELDLFWDVWKILEEKYPFEEPNSEDKIYGAIKGLADSYGDRNTTFLPPVESQYLNEEVSGRFGGIGVEIDRVEGYFIIVAPLEGSPAKEAGLLAGDVVIEVDGIDIVGASIDDTVSKIRGEVGSPVTLTILRENSNEKREITIVRDIVSVPISRTEIIDDVFVVHLYNFNEYSEREFKKNITSFKNSNKDKILLDLRNNPGGYLDAAIDLTSYFLPQGKIITTEDFGISELAPKVLRSYGHTDLSGFDYKIAVLINRGSASASEIVASALSEHGIATVLGETSYGKGSVQELVSLPNNTSLKVTIAEWLTPKGNQIDKVGIKPGILIENPTGPDDTQLEKAINFINSINTEN